ncbi:SIR2-like domain-containing protein, partial [Candidatus Methanophagaceae archaeon]
YINVRETLNSNNLEGILTILENLTDSQNPIARYIVPLLLSKDETTINEGENREVTDIVELAVSSVLSKRLKSKIIEFVKKNCALKEEEEILQDIIRVYNLLFEILKHNSTFFDIFTTNYDLIIEKYYDLLTGEYYFNKKYDYVENLRRISYTDGFFSIAFTASGSRGFYDDYVWNPKGYDEIIKYANNKDIRTIKLFKLHGSIDQYIEGDKIVKRDILYSTPTTSGEERLESMIYPMREKEVYKDPFFELFTRLKTSLLSEKICIVIGYSFGDEHIRNIFFDAVKRNPEIKILLGDKNPNEVMKKLEPIKDNLIPIEGEFGKETFFARLEEELEKCKSNN